MEFADRASSDDLPRASSLLFDVLIRVSQTLRLRWNVWLAEYGLNDGRYAVLKTLANAPAVGYSQAELAEQLGQSESNISTLIERMQRDGLVSRSRSDADRRKRILLISPAGLSNLSQVELKQPDWAARELRGMSIADRSLLNTLLQQLANSLQEAREAVREETTTLRMSEYTKSVSTENNRKDPIDDPKSPQFALHQMLLALGVHAGTDSKEKDVA
jgi:DNA-binding MarR family transcriptional regulator